MHYVGVAIDASSREVRFALIDEHSPTSAPDFRILGYGAADLPLVIRDLHAAVQSTLKETPARSVGVRRQDASDRAYLRTATIDRLLAEGAVLAATRELVNDVAHITGSNAAKNLGVDKPTAVEDTRALLKEHGQLMKWTDAYMVARSLLPDGLLHRHLTDS